MTWTRAPQAVPLALPHPPSSQGPLCPPPLLVCSDPVLRLEGPLTKQLAVPGVCKAAHHFRNKRPPRGPACKSEDRGHVASGLQAWGARPAHHWALFPDGLGHSGQRIPRRERLAEHRGDPCPPPPRPHPPGVEEERVGRSSEFSFDGFGCELSLSKSGLYVRWVSVSADRKSVV